MAGIEGIASLVGGLRVRHRARMIGPFEQLTPNELAGRTAQVRSQWSKARAASAVVV